MATSFVAAQRPARSRSPAVLLSCSGVLGFLLCGGGERAFVGAPAGPVEQRGDIVAMRSIVTRKAGMQRREKVRSMKIKKVILEDREVSVLYKELLGPQSTDTPFEAATAAMGDEITVEVTEFPFGVMRYQPGKDWKGAMVKDVAQAYYIGDPFGQAFKAGVESGMVVKSINGKSMLTEPFDEIMEALGDQHFRVRNPDSPPVKLPLTITFARSSR
mmetsp:Transcript_119942/g.334601  ORF Transcript_119942/g.334601 Transcript_119942/m.334601 type:complete len:216 (-) Transcript_119942:196-843(-)